MSVSDRQYGRPVPNYRPRPLRAPFILGTIAVIVGLIMALGFAYNELPQEKDKNAVPGSGSSKRSAGAAQAANVLTTVPGYEPTTTPFGTTIPTTNVTMSLSSSVVVPGVEPTTTSPIEPTIPTTTVTNSLITSVVVRSTSDYGNIGSTAIPDTPTLDPGSGSSLILGPSVTLVTMVPVESPTSTITDGPPVVGPTFTPTIGGTTRTRSDHAIVGAVTITETRGSDDHASVGTVTVTGPSGTSAATAHSTDHGNVGSVTVTESWTSRDGVKSTIVVGSLPIFGVIGSVEVTETPPIENYPTLGLVTVTSREPTKTPPVAVAGVSFTRAVSDYGVVGTPVTIGNVETTETGQSYTITRTVDIIATLNEKELSAFRDAQWVTLTDSAGSPTATVTQTPKLTVLTDSNGTPTLTVITFPTAPSSKHQEPHVVVYYTSNADYFIGFFLPTLLAIMLTIPIRIIDLKAKQLQPWHALTQPEGATAEDSLCLKSDGIHDILVAVQSLAAGQPLVFITTLLLICSVATVPLSAAAIGMKMHGSCSETSFKGCAMTLGVFPAPAKAAMALLAFMIILLLLVLALVRRWPTGVATNPSSMAAVASLSTNPAVSELLSSISEGENGEVNGKQLRRALKGSTFKLGYFENQSGSLEYGILIHDEDGIAQHELGLSSESFSSIDSEKEAAMMKPTRSYSNDHRGRLCWDNRQMTLVAEPDTMYVGHDRKKPVLVEEPQVIGWDMEGKEATLVSEPERSWDKERKPTWASEETITPEDSFEQMGWVNKQTTGLGFARRRDRRNVRRQLPETGRHPPLAMLSYRIRIAFLVFLTGIMVIILVYNNTGGDTGFENFMSTPHVGVESFFTFLGTLCTFVWGSFFGTLAVLDPFCVLAQGDQDARKSILLSPPSNAFTGMWRAARLRRPFLGLVAFVGILSEFLPTLLSNVPFHPTKTWEMHLLCSWMAFGILCLMWLALVGSFFLTWPYLPADPTTIAGAMFYVCDSRMLRSFEGLSPLEKEDRDARVEEMGLRFRFGNMMGSSGRRRLGVDYLH